jgi:hypothetical protein
MLTDPCVSYHKFKNVQKYHYQHKCFVDNGAEKSDIVVGAFGNEASWNCRYRERRPCLIRAAGPSGPVGSNW